MNLSNRERLCGSLYSFIGYVWPTVFICSTEVVAGCVAVGFSYANANKEDRLTTVAIIIM